MTEQTPAPRRTWRPRGIGLAWLALLAMLAVAFAVAPSDRSDALALANPDASGVTELRLVLDSLSEQPLVIVAMDADLGTYPEIRATTRAALDDLLRRDASLAFVSVTPEGRAIAAAEVERLSAAGAADESLLDLGYVAGVEAGLVRLVGSVLPSGSTGVVADAVRERGGGLGAFDLALLVGGSDVGPRTWIEQVATRLPTLPMVAIAPTFAQPELAPYLRSGQLSGLIATVRDGAAYREAIASGAGTDRAPSALAMLAGLVVALVVLARQLLGAVPAIGRRLPGEGLEEDQP
jgi:hypothetical protein